jgi:hypothetical protein
MGTIFVQTLMKSLNSGLGCRSVGVMASGASPKSIEVEMSVTGKAERWHVERVWRAR